MMKKIILLGLISLTMCLSKPAEEQAAITPAAVAAVTNVTTTGDTKEKAQNASTPHVETQAAVKNATEPKPAASLPTVATNASEPTPPHKEETPVDNKTTEKEAPPKAKEDSKENPKNITETKATTDKAATDKPTSDMTGKNATTMKPELPNSTKAPKSEDKHVLQARGFDGPSFIGGMILTLGILAIGFMGFKYYKNQTERNYHTL